MSYHLTQPSISPMFMNSDTMNYPEMFVQSHGSEEEENRMVSQVDLIHR